MRRRCHHEGLWCLSAYEEMGLSRWLSGQESTYSAGDTGDVGLIPGSGRSPGGENGNPLQYSCLGNPMDGGAWQAAVCGGTRVRHDVATKPPPSHFLPVKEG